MIRTITTLTIAAAALGLAACSSDSSDTAAPATSTPAPAPATPAEGTKAPAPATAHLSDPRCAAAGEQDVIAVANGLTDKSLTLTNAQMIQDGDLTFLGATTVRPDGKFENRSDVWVLSGMMPFSATGGARSTTEWPKASSAPLQISAGDERVRAVDTCVVNLTRN
ncbi:hypothetical protein GCM10023094_23640 [Rhodococcus olei]|uniref:Lipoprotein antigen n=1 Tax=Rhodococcus olei TaxID=2161675 RepID=A0ABP8P3L0_9NOCA